MARRPKRGAKRGLKRRVGRALVVFLAIAVSVPAGLIVLYRFAPVPLTPLMVIRLAEGYGVEKDWVPLEQISPHLPASVLASEDNRFCQHLGFDVAAIERAIEAARDGERLRGASTVTMQTAKNLFLWPHRSFVRKAFEAYLTPMLELIWPKRRILEVYLNIVEFGPGIYGAEAAAQHHFGKPAADLTAREAALLAVVLPNPLELSASSPSDYVSRRAATIQARVQQLGDTIDCY